jgi:hypothetical protein
LPVTDASLSARPAPSLSAVLPLSREKPLKLSFPVRPAT